MADRALTRTLHVPSTWQKIQWEASSSFIFAAPHASEDSSTGQWMSLKREFRELEARLDRPRLDPIHYNDCLCRSRGARHYQRSNHRHSAPAHASLLRAQTTRHTCDLRSVRHNARLSCGPGSICKVKRRHGSCNRRHAEPSGLLPGRRAKHCEHCRSASSGEPAM